MVIMTLIPGLTLVFSDALVDLTLSSCMLYRWYECSLVYWSPSLRRLLSRSQNSRLPDELVYRLEFSIRPAPHIVLTAKFLKDSNTDMQVHCCFVDGKVVHLLFDVSKEMVLRKDRYMLRSLPQILKLDIKKQCPLPKNNWEQED